jgi:hypothetical protein
MPFSSLGMKGASNPMGLLSAFSKEILLTFDKLFNLGNVSLLMRIIKCWF